MTAVGVTLGQMMPSGLFIIAFETEGSILDAYDLRCGAKVCVLFCLTNSLQDLSPSLFFPLPRENPGLLA